jgi:hypothetical protein
MAWNEYRCTSVTKEARKKKSLRSDFRNPFIEAIRAIPFPFDPDYPLVQKVQREWIAAVFRHAVKDAQKQERQCSREKKYLQAEHWRDVSVFAEQVKRLLVR